MESENEKTVEQEWQWCLVGNIVGEHEYGENHEIRHGNKQFRPETKVFINLVFGGMGHEKVLVLGIPRHSRNYIEVVISRKHIENLRLQRVYKPAVLKRMKNSNYEWYGNSDKSRDRIIEALIWLDPESAERAIDKFVIPGQDTPA